MYRNREDSFLITKAAVSARRCGGRSRDSTASYIFYFKKDGESLGINIKMLLSGDGYPVDIALSPTENRSSCPSCT